MNEGVLTSTRWYAVCLYVLNGLSVIDLDLALSTAAVKLPGGRARLERMQHKATN